MPIVLQKQWDVKVVTVPGLDNLKKNSILLFHILSVVQCVFINIVVKHYLKNTRKNCVVSLKCLF